MRSFVIVLVALTALVAADYCGSAAMLSDAGFATLVANIEAQGFSSDKVLVVEEFVANSTLGFSGNQTAQMLALFGFSSDQVKILDTISQYVLSLTCADVVSILSKFSFSSDKLAVLKVIVDLTIQSDLAVNNATIVNTFSMSVDQAAAQSLIDSASGVTCTWGSITQSRVVFVIDVSSSMNTVFNLNGFSHTRLSYVQAEIDQVIRKQLRSDQAFNIEIFSSSVSFWAAGILPVNSTTIDSAASYAAGLVANGGTGATAALVSAWSQDVSLEAIYFLSDGVPNDPTTALATAKANEATHAVPIFATALAADAGGKAFLQQLAQLSGGVYREIDGN